MNDLSFQPRPTVFKHRSRVLTASLVSLAFASAALAAPVKPDGLYSESAIEVEGHGGPQSQTGKVVAEAKEWAEGQWNRLKSLWGPDRERKPAPSGIAVSDASEVKIKTNETSKTNKTLDEDVGGIPLLSIGREEKFSASRFALDAETNRILNQKLIYRMESPVLLSRDELRNLLNTQVAAPKGPQKTRRVARFRKGKIDRGEFDRILLNLKPEAKLRLETFKPLTQDETRFLSGLLLYQQGDKCAAAVGLFHKLSKESAWRAEADYYLAMCSKQLGLGMDFMARARRIVETKDLYYGPKILKEITAEIPYEYTVSFGGALYRAASNPKWIAALDPATKVNVAYLLAEYGVATERFKSALYWAKQVPSTHEKHMQARFVEALAEYQTGSKEKALRLQKDLISSLKNRKETLEFQALVYLNVARMHFQDRDFKEARENFLQVYKDHPLWVQSLTDMGWSQLMSGDYEGAIGNMYSIQSPFFSSVYKPESYVIRTIGYLSLCQYGDAYRTLTELEKDYRPQYDRIREFMDKKGKRALYETVKAYLKNRKVAEVDGLPSIVIREMARHRDFTNLQKGMNRQIDERAIYSRIDKEVTHSLHKVRALVTQSRGRIKELRENLGLIGKKPGFERNRIQWLADLRGEQEKLNDHFFHIDLFDEAMAALPDYKKDVVGDADERIFAMEAQMEKVLTRRLNRMKIDLARILDNNELLRYEAFAGSGENIRFQVAGGESGHRIPASVQPKSLKWDFDGEYWEDEIGHYRSSLKNNCPKNERQRKQASLDGGT